MVFTGPSFSGIYPLTARIYSCFDTNFIFPFVKKEGIFSCPLLSGYLCFSIMEGEESLRKFSPEVMVKELAVRPAVSLLPRIILFHGTSDCSMPTAERWVKLKLLATSDFITVPSNELLHVSWILV